VGEETVQLGASVPYTRIMDHLRAELPGLALAAHTVGSPQIRNRGSVGGNLGAASPAGDSHPALLSAGAEVEAESVRGTRLIPVEEFFTGVKRNALEPDELIKRVHIKKADGPQQFSKVGTRNAMVIAVCAFGIALHPETRTVKTGIGSAAPTPLRARAAEDFLNARRGRVLGERQDHHPVDRQAVRGPRVRRLQPDRRRARYREVPPSRGRHHGPPHAGLDLGAVPRHRPHA
jgi:CO/xanthine dehydrogenase FAD-binding subunit